MMNRRELLTTTAAFGLLAAGRAFGAAAPYDLVIKGGYVIDPASGVNAVRDVAVAGGKIAAVAATIEAGGAQTVNAAGKYVIPGMIDIHSHAGDTQGGPAMNLEDGITGYVDAGSRGADKIDDVIAVVKSGPQLGRILINIARTGLLPGGELQDINNADVALARDTIAKHRDVIAGIKARLSKNVAGNNDVEALRRAKEAAAPSGVPVMIHIGQSLSPLSQVMALMKKGDIVTHLFAPPPEAIVDDAGKILPSVIEAQQRGVWFDMGHGRGGHFRWDTTEKILAAGFLPDTLSTDWTPQGRVAQFVDLPTVMSKLMYLGMSLEQVVACVTCNAARVFEAFREKGSLKVGSPADISLLELRGGGFDFLDNYNEKRTGKQKLFPAGTVLAGKWIPRPA
ncbi:MAG: amidohydrolase/deacetylase family metallohydrolase [Rhodospirillaceae bacterium]|nr:amidohydrolase/deacetylase family metallohydrolase [Rhodospirillaceae bacterium]